MEKKIQAEKAIRVPMLGLYTQMVSSEEGEPSVQNRRILDT